MLGFIFYEPSHRYVTPAEVSTLLDASERFSTHTAAPDVVGVFVNKDVRFINEVIDEAGLHFVQLHGIESPEMLQEIHRPVLKALHVSSEEDLEQVDRYKDAAWRLLLDTPTPQGGGTGVTHDWQLARLAAQRARILLAGGLTPDNVTDAIQQVHPWGVDVSSGIETNKQKDTDKIQKFLHAVRNLYL